MKKLVLIAVLVCCTLAAQAQGKMQPMIVVMPNGTIATQDMMGGMETIETAFRNPELFRYVWVLSSSFSPGHQLEYVDEIKLNEIAPALNGNFQDLVFTQGGPADIAYRNCQEALGYLDAAGISYTYMENAQAGHSWATWRADLAVLAPTLFRSQPRAALPGDVGYREGHNRQVR